MLANQVLLFLKMLVSSLQSFAGDTLFILTFRMLIIGGFKWAHTF